ncbi:MAG: IS66 family transposase, partial [Beggiatoa sp.]|nr:IS66 family transposase [Beggiatoa sp.]
TIERQAAQIVELERRVNQNSRNSHKPPSSDGPGTFRRGQLPAREKRRKRGGQTGHEGHHRDLLPSEEVDERVEVRPSSCEHCGADLVGSDPAPERRQKVEIPPIQPQVTEYRLHALKCGCCGEVTRGRLPEGVPAGCFMSRLLAVIALLSGAYRLSKRQIQQLLGDLLGIGLSLGSIITVEQSVSQTLAEPVREAQEYVREQTVVHSDETSWKQALKRAWLWVAVTPWVTVFLIRLSRGKVVAEELLGEGFAGYLVSDRWSGYSWVELRRRQVCFAHLKRDFQKIADAQGDLARIGQSLLEQTQRLFKLWHRVGEGTLKRASFATYASVIRGEIRALLEQGMVCADAKIAGMCRKILSVEPAMWTFVRVGGVDPTNNDGERSLRHAVLWRKGSYGTQSEDGSRYVERILTVVMTLRQQRRSVLEYLTATCQSALCHESPPSLLPQTPDSQPGLAIAA